MKKPHIIVVVIFCTLLLFGCSANNVTITLPAGFMGKEIINQKTFEQEDGVVSIIKNDDNTITITLTKAKHKELLATYKASIDETIDELVEGETTPYILSVTYDEDCTEFEVTVDRKGYESAFLEMTPFLLGISGGFYQRLNGVENPSVVINFKDETSGEIFNTVNYPPEDQQTETVGTNETVDASKRTSTHSMGDTASLNDWEINIGGVEVITENDEVHPEYLPERGQSYVQLYMFVENNGTEANTFLPTVSSNSDIQIKVRYRDKYNYSPTFFLDEEGNAFMYDKFMNPLSSVSGSVIFKIPNEVLDEGKNELQIIITEKSQIAIFDLDLSYDPLEGLDPDQLNQDE